MENATANVSGRNRKPPIPGIKAMGQRTMIVVSVATSTGMVTSTAPSKAALMRDLPSE